MSLALRLFLPAVILASSLAVPVAASPYEDAVAAYSSGAYATAHPLFRVLADQGHADAQFHLGLMYHNGQGLPQDDAEAARWVRFAADQGHAQAQYNLGLMYLNGEGVPQDYAEAVRWWGLAAEQGHTEAQYNLGFR